MTNLINYQKKIYKPKFFKILFIQNKLLFVFIHHFLSRLLNIVQKLTDISQANHRQPIFEIPENHFPHRNLFVLYLKFDYLVYICNKIEKSCKNFLTIQFSWDKNNVNNNTYFWVCTLKICLFPKWFRSTFKRKFAFILST